MLHGQDRKPQISKSKDGHLMQDINIPLLNLHNPLHWRKPSSKYLTITL